MANSAPVNLDKAWLENFLTHDVRPFAEQIRKIMADDPDTDVPALANLLSEGEHGPAVLPGALLPLTLGGMQKDADTNGSHLDTAVTKMINDIKTIFEEQKTLFESIDENLATSIEKLFATQSESLDKIDGEKLLDIFGDIDEALGGGGEDD
ncbi:type VII secretion system-associated protein [Streptomyces liangshanensis]|uniref:Type VII secretion system-associated protein n=1 Tax=Streptomyces liangshanensis TaxID=2717324 RepID=A0A6G9GVG2_9ACTN|nr:type VII secretion system-associated protein [Streptomyces liangshanensis]QIQ02066.1 type VII secretion system-associated protein [Streptomyces liangshanensis]